MPGFPYENLLDGLMTLPDFSAACLSIFEDNGNNDSDHALADLAISGRYTTEHGEDVRVKIAAPPAFQERDQEEQEEEEEEGAPLPLPQGGKRIFGDMMGVTTSLPMNDQRINVLPYKLRRVDNRMKLAKDVVQPPVCNNIRVGIFI